jgi:positive regulator of sigma E activity
MLKLKIVIYIALTFVFLVINFMVKDVFYSKLFTSFTIIIGAFSSNKLLSQNHKNNEQH